MKQSRLWRRNGWALLLLAALLGLALAIVFGNQLRDSSATSSPVYSTAPVRRADFEMSVTVPGNITAVNDLNLTFQVSGVVETVEVKPGQIVQKGDTLAQLDNRDFQLNLNVAEANLKQAQAKLDLVRTTTAKDLVTAQANLRQAQNKLEQAKNGNASPGEINAAKAAVDQAQANYNKLATAPNANDISAAQADLNKAKANLDKLKAGAGALAIKKAESDLEAAKQNLDKVKSALANAKETARLNQEQAQKNYDAADKAYKKIYTDNRNPDGSLKETLPPGAIESENKAKADVDNAKTELDKAKSNYENAKNQETSGTKEAQALMDSAQATLDKLKAGPAAQELAAAEADVQRAQAFLDKARQGATAEQLREAQAQINQAKANLDKLSAGGTDKDIAIAQTEVDKWQAIVTDLSTGSKAAELNQAQAGLEAADIMVKQARFKLEQATLRAPFNGVVGAVNMVVGQAVGQNTGMGNNALAGSIALTGLSNLQVNLNLDEKAVLRVQPGQTAQVRLDNLASKQIFVGVVTYVAPKAIFDPVQGKSSYAAYVELSNQTGVDPLSVGVRPGMSATVRVIIERQSNVLLVPNQSVKKSGADNIVEILLNSGQVVTVPVIISNSNQQEVVLQEPSLLKPNDRVIISSSAGSQNIPPITTPTGLPVVTPLGVTTPLVVAPGR